MVDELLGIARPSNDLCTKVGAPSCALHEVRFVLRRALLYLKRRERASRDVWQNLLRTCLVHMLDSGQPSPPGKKSDHSYANGLRSESEITRLPL